MNERKRKVSDLHNSLKFGLESVTMIELDDSFQLEVRNFRNTLFSQTFPTITAARSAFQEHFGKDGIQPHWTDFFDPQGELDELELTIINQERMRN